MTEIGPITPSIKIIFTKKYPLINTHEFRLENGIKVFLKPTKNKEKSFAFEAISMGGYSHANLIDLPSAKILDDVILESPLGNFSRVELNNKINPSRLTAAGRGEFNPIIDNDSDESRSKNRRIEIILYPSLDKFYDFIQSD